MIRVAVTNEETRVWQAISRALAALEQTIAIGFLVGATAVLFVNVVMRYLFRAGFSWAEEFITFAMIWISFVGASICVHVRAHVAMRLVVESVGKPRARRAYEIALGLVSVAFFAGALIFSVRHVLFVSSTGQLSPAMQIPMAWAYLALPVGFGLMLIRTIEQLFAVLRHAPSEEPAGP